MSHFPFEAISSGQLIEQTKVIPEYAVMLNSVASRTVSSQHPCCYSACAVLLQQPLTDNGTTLLEHRPRAIRFAAEASTSRISSSLLEPPNPLPISEVMVPSLQLSGQSHGGNTKNRLGFLPAPENSETHLDRVPVGCLGF